MTAAARLSIAVLTVATEAGDDEAAACVHAVAAARAHPFVDVRQVLVVAPDAADRLRRRFAGRTPAVDVFVHTAGNPYRRVLPIGSGVWVMPLAVDHRPAHDIWERLWGEIGGDEPAGMVYGDHALVDERLEIVDVVRQPAPSPERWRCTNEAAVGALVAAADLDHVGAFADDEPGAGVHDMLLRLIERGRPLRRITAVLVARPFEGATGVDTVALDAHLRRSGITADAVLEDAGRRARVLRRPVALPSVSVVIPTRGSRARVWGRTTTLVVGAVRSLVERSTVQPAEFVVVADASTPPSVIDRLRSICGARLRVVEWNAPFNFSAKVNAGAEAAAGDLLLLLNDDTSLVESDSIGEMAALFADPVVADGPAAVGIVGAELRYEDGSLQHAGHVYAEQPLHAFVGWGSGAHRMLRHPRECSGVTAAAMMVDRATFDSVGGFPDEFPLDFNDVEFCLRVRAAGKRILWTPHAVWHHFEGRTRPRGPSDEEFDALIAPWRATFADDPYYHPGLEPRRADWMPRPGWATDVRIAGG